MIEFLSQPMPWYVGGPLIGLMVPLLLLLGNKNFGISSTYKHVCAACIPGDVSFFKYDWKSQSWSLFLALGVLLGGVLAGIILPSESGPAISDATVSDLEKLGITDFSAMVPPEIFSLENLLSFRSLFILIIGGILVGFGTRYAGGCTSGHAIMGISSLQWPSLVATICFFIGGAIMTHLILPFILG